MKINNSSKILIVISILTVVYSIIYLSILESIQFILMIILLLIIGIGLLQMDLTPLRILRKK